MLPLRAILRRTALVRLGGLLLAAGYTGYMLLFSAHALTVRRGLTGQPGQLGIVGVAVVLPLLGGILAALTSWRGIGARGIEIGGFWGAPGPSLGIEVALSLAGLSWLVVQVTALFHHVAAGQYSVSLMFWQGLLALPALALLLVRKQVRVDCEGKAIRVGWFGAIGPWSRTIPFDQVEHLRARAGGVEAVLSEQRAVRLSPPGVPPAALLALLTERTGLSERTGLTERTGLGSAG